MSSISVDYDVLNQKGSPAWYSDTFANIPTPGYKGRMFISTDTFAFYRDNGTGWDLVGGPGTGTITGAGVSGQVTYFIGTDTIGGNNNLFYDITNSRLGIGTATPGAPLDIHSTGTAAQFNGTGVNNSFVLFQNAGSSKWRIGNLYNSGANDYQIFDVTNSTARLTIKNTGASTLIGTFTATSLIKSGGTNLQILLADGSTTPTSTFGAGSVTNVSALTLGTTGTDLTSSVVNSTTTPVITLNVPTASATNRGALSSADWTTFNNKQATLSLTTTGTSGAATLVGATLNIPNYTNVGTVTSVAALTLGTTGTDLSSSVANSTSTPVITLNVPTASATNRGALSSADWTTFNNKQGTISVTAPVVLTGATISMPAATTSVSGYLTSTDWNTFNSKTSNLGTVTDVVALTIGTTGIDITSTAVTTTTTPVITLNIPTASASNRGALSSTDWTIFNNKQATLSLTTTGTSGAATLVANTLNIPDYGSALSGYVTLATTQTISGAKTFTSTIVATQINLGGGASQNQLQSAANNDFILSNSGNFRIINSTNTTALLTIANSGVTTFSNYILTDNSILIKTGFNTSTSGYTGIGAVATGLTINLGTGTTGSLLFNTGASYSYTFPAATGTLALTSDLGSYLPLSGGTLTGTLNGTIANFNGVVTAGATGTNGSISIANQNGSTEVGMNIRPNQTKNGSLSFTENAVSDRWVMGIIGGDSKLYFKSASSWIGAGTTAFTLDSAGAGVFSTNVTATTQGTNSSFNTGAFIAKSNGNAFRYTQIGYDNTSNYGWIQALEQGTAYTNLILNGAGGNIGIGSSINPTYKLEVSSDGGSQRIRVGTLQNNDNTPKFEAITSNGTTVANSAWLKVNDASGFTIGQSSYTKTGGDSGNFANISAEVEQASIVVNGSGGATILSTLGINGTSNNVRSGTYTPTLVAGTNCSAVTAYPCQYMQVDKVVTVSGQVYGSATAVTTETQFTMSVPVGSNFTQVYQCGGTGRSAQGGVAPSGAGYVAFIQAVSTDTVRFSYTAPAVLGTGGNFWFSFTYQII